LWRAVKLLFKRFARAAHFASVVISKATQSLIEWLPTRWGKAYSSAFGAFAVIAGLWVADQIRAAPTVAADGTASLRAPVDEDDPILARIDGRYVHLSEIEASARASGFLNDNEVLTPQSAFERELVQNYVEQRLLARAAQDEGIHRAPGVLRRVRAARDRVLAAAFIESETGKVVTPDTIERFYNAQRDVTVLGDEVRARHILVATQEEANIVMEELKAGADFGDLARSKSIDPGTARLGGEIGWFSRDMMTRRFANAAFSTEPGNLADPVETEFGWHVIEVLGRRPTNAVPFSDVSDQIANFLRSRAIDNTLGQLSADQQVVYFRPEPSDETPASESAAVVNANDASGD
ncbi:MAG: peptidylprolyl isomerase, partial [Marinicaulis sp.]|nr:peptidylprolyl isomerase [Marinicaulis sp.]